MQEVDVIRNATDPLDLPLASTTPVRVPEDQHNAEPSESSIPRETGVADFRTQESGCALVTQADSHRSGFRLRMTLGDLPRLLPDACWMTDHGTVFTSRELDAGKGKIRHSRRIVFDGRRVFADRTGLKARSPLLRLLVESESRR